MRVLVIAAVGFSILLPASALASDPSPTPDGCSIAPAACSDLGRANPLPAKPGQNGPVAAPAAPVQVSVPPATGSCTPDTSCGNDLGPVNPPLPPKNEPAAGTATPALPAVSAPAAADQSPAPAPAPSIGVPTTKLSVPLIGRHRISAHRAFLRRR